MIPSGSQRYETKSSRAKRYRSCPPQLKYTEKLLLDYRYMESKGIKPRFDFGFGLSYTTFEYSSLEISAFGTGVRVVATIKNTGVVPGTEIPQLYLGFPANAGEPPKVLRGFDEVFLQAGGSSRVTFSLNQRDLRSVPGSNGFCNR